MSTSCSPSVKILVAYHKKEELIKNDFIVPIHLGRALAKERAKHNSLAASELQWFVQNMIGDDTGDNISHLNHCFNEMTGMYWAWKNYDQLGSPDYIGFMHYRRLFDFSEYFRPTGSSLLEKCCLEKKYVLEILKDYNLIFHRKILFSPVLDKGRIGFDFYRKNIPLSPQYYPELYKKYKLFKADLSFSHYNMFIMRKDDFFEYCETMFDILINTYNQLIKQTGTTPIPRYIGYASEYLTSFYLDTLKERSDINALNVRIRFLYNKFFYNLRLVILWFKINILGINKLQKVYRAAYVHKHVNFR